MATKQTSQSAIWNRDDRDLLIELRTNMGNLSSDIALARSEVKELSIGMSARLLNLESNSVSKVQLIEMEGRVRKLEDTENNWIGKQQFISGAIGIGAGLLGAWIQGGKF